VKPAQSPKLAALLSSFLSICRISVCSISVLGFASTGCGKNGIGGLVSSARFQTIEENGELYGDLKVMLNTGSVLFPSFDIPIFNPKDPAVSYGEIALRDALGQGTELGIRVNLNSVAGGALSSDLDASLLPNGRAIPVALANDVRPVAVRIKESSRVYFAFGPKTAMVGTAIVISEFDKLARYIGGVDVFFPFQGQDGIRGAVGLFSSAVPNQSGLAVFVDVGSVLPSSVTPKTMGSSMAKISSEAQPIVFFTQKGMSSGQSAQLGQFARSLGSHGKRLGLR